MNSLIKKRLRLAVDVTSYGEVYDALSRSGPRTWAANDVSIELGFLEGKTLVDVGSVTSVIVQIKDKDDLSGEPLAAKSTTSLDNAVTQAEWESGDATKAHAKVEFTAEELNLDLGGAESKDFHLVVVVTTESGANLVTAAVSTLTLCNDGYNDGVSSPSPVDAEWRTQGGYFQLMDQATSLYHTVTLRTVGGSVVFEINQVGEA